ncbi:restriction endonuclease [Streptomyces sp. NPDC051217]|uniref:restriction endonuclease n=1 Tax=Streptomyces sp. NPDC051217 TaxID=3365644 RepID=UPI00379A142E
MSRRSHGLIGTWAEIQQQQRRQEEAQRRSWAQAQREQERQQRAAERAASRNRREQQAAYRQRREADARQRTEELDRRVNVLESLLATGCAAAAFTPAALARPEQVEPFAPGQLGVPVSMPDPNNYPPQQGGWGFGANRQAQEQARARFEYDWRAAQEAEARRQQQLAAYRAQYQQWADEQLAAVRHHNAGIAELVATLHRGEPGAVVDYFTAALYASQGWPEDIPRQVSASFDAGARQLILNWELPALSIVPDASLVRYMPGADRDKEVRRPATERRTLYRDVLAQCVLLALHDLFAADQFGVLDSVVLNGFVDDTDPATGHRAQKFLATVMVSRAAFDQVNLAQVSAPDCLVDGLRGQLSDRPDRGTAVRPGRLPGEAGRNVVTHGGDEEPDLYEMDPLEFEELVAELFRAMGMQAVTTKRSGDGGVDVDALDPEPIRGGKIIVQVKRYRNTVPPSAVRDLYGTVQDAGANKGVLITTSTFGPGSHAFAVAKPLTLIAGSELVDLLHRHGLSGRLGRPPQQPVRADPAPDVDTGGGNGVDPDPEPELDDASVLGLAWSGSVSLDVCALVCKGGRVLAEDQFVFFNNPRTPDDSVQMMPGFGEDKAAVWVRFEQLPQEADRLVLVAAVDPEANPDADLSGLTNARIRLSDPSGTGIDELPVSDGRAGETALVLGSFRKRAGGDWDFVTGGKGYPGGLVALVEEYGIDVE